MAVLKEPFLVIADTSGGLNTTTTPIALADTQVTVAQNVEWLNTLMPSKRNGTTAVTMNGTYRFGTEFNGTIWALMRFVPKAGVRSQSLFVLSADSIFGHLVGGTTWASRTPSPADTPTAGITVQATNGISFNDKLFIAWNSAVDRLHVWDGTTLRRVGLPPPAAPTVSNTGAGAYAAVLRYYKVRWTRLVSGVQVTTSELSAASAAFTPSGAGTAARVARPALANEGETNWEVWGSTDGVLYYYLSSTIVATTAYDDSAATTAYSGNELAPTVGDFTVPVSARYVTVHDNRLFLAGAWENAALDSRVWWTPIVGTTARGDDERIPTANHVDVDLSEGGPITGLFSLNSTFVWKYRAMYKLVATGDATEPYIVSQLSDTIGCVRHHTIVGSEDENGNPAVYWLGPNGPYRFGDNGIQYLGNKIRETWDTVLATGVVDVYSFGVYYAEHQQVCWWVPTQAFEASQLVLVFHIRTGAWSTFTGPLAKAFSACQFSSVPGATMGQIQKPYVGSIVAGQIVKADTGTTDAGVSFQGSLQTKAYPLGGFMQNCGITEAQIYAKAFTGQSLTLTLTRDFGLDARSADIDLTASEDETRVVRKVEDIAMTSAQVVQLTVGDSASADTGAWELDAVVVRYRREETR